MTQRIKRLKAKLKLSISKLEKSPYYHAACILNPELRTIRIYETYRYRVIKLWEEYRRSKNFLPASYDQQQPPKKGL